MANAVILQAVNNELLVVLLCLELQLLGVTTYLAKSEKWGIQRALGINESYMQVERKSANGLAFSLS